LTSDTLAAFSAGLTAGGQQRIFIHVTIADYNGSLKMPYCSSFCYGSLLKYKWLDLFDLSNEWVTHALE